MWFLWNNSIEWWLWVQQGATGALKYIFRAYHIGFCKHKVLDRWIQVIKYITCTTWALIVIFHLLDEKLLRINNFDNCSDRKYWNGLLTGLHKGISADNIHHDKVEKQMPFNVIMYGFDSLSRNAFIRKLPRSHEFMTKRIFWKATILWVMEHHKLSYRWIYTFWNDFFTWNFIHSMKNISKLINKFRDSPNFIKNSRRLIKKISFPLFSLKLFSSSLDTPSSSYQKHVVESKTPVPSTYTRSYSMIMRKVAMWQHSTRIYRMWAHFPIDSTGLSSNQQHITCDHFIWRYNRSWANIGICVLVIPHVIGSWWTTPLRCVNRYFLYSKYLRLKDMLTYCILYFQ